MNPSQPLSRSEPDLRLDFHDCARRYTARLYLLRGAQSVSTRPCRWSLLDSESDLSDVRGQTRQIRRVRKCAQSCRGTIMEGMLQNGNYQREANANTNAMETRKEVKKPPAGSFHHRPDESIHRNSQRCYAFSKLEVLSPFGFSSLDDWSWVILWEELRDLRSLDQGAGEVSIDRSGVKSQGGQMYVAIIRALCSASQSSDFPVLSPVLPLSLLPPASRLPLATTVRNVRSFSLTWICGNSCCVYLASGLSGRNDSEKRMIEQWLSNAHAGLPDARRDVFQDCLLDHMEISIVEAEKRANRALNLREFYTVYLIETKWARDDKRSFCKMNDLYQ